MEMHKDCGIGLPLVNREEGWHKKTLTACHRRKKSGGRAEEEVRILYVALTRAIDRLGDRGNGQGSGQPGRGTVGETVVSGYGICTAETDRGRDLRGASGIGRERR